MNISQPEMIPTIKSIWKEFLPWFMGKEVSIGADEYEASLADDYIEFVNTMADYIYAQSGKVCSTCHESHNNPLLFNKRLLFNLRALEYGEQMNQAR